MAESTAGRFAFAFWVLAILTNTITVLGSVSLQLCGGSSAHDKVAEIYRDGTASRFYCYGIKSIDVEWKIDDYPVAWCLKDKQKCTQTLEEDLFHFSRTPALSTLTVNDINRSKYDEGFFNQTLSCVGSGGSSSQDSCPFDFVEKADGTCRAQILTSSLPWKGRVKCEITTEAYSIRNRYQCTFHHTWKGTTETIGWTAMWNPNTDATPNDVQKTCSFTWHLDVSQEGTHNYSVSFIPGRTRVVAPQELKIRQPVKPRLTCKPVGFVPENSTITCRCETDSLGQPAGSLKMLTASVQDPSQYPSLIHTGDSGDKAIEVTKTLSRRDHRATKIMCETAWGGRSYPQSGLHYTTRVRYPPSRVTLTANRTTVMENGNVELLCQAEDGQPAPALTLTGGPQGREIGQTRGRHMVKGVNPRCEDHAVYACEASNGMGPVKSSSLALNVQCKPRDIVFSAPVVINFKDIAVSFTFRVVANPIPIHVNFAFLGPEQPGSSTPATTTASQDGQLRDIVLHGQCQSIPREAGLPANTAFCNVTVLNVTSPAASGMYRGTVVSLIGYASFTFRVFVNGTDQDEVTSTGVSIGVLSGTIGAGFFFLVLVTVFIVIRVKRKKGPHTAAKVRDDGGEAIQPGIGKNQEPLVEDTQDGGDVYSVVNKAARISKNEKGSVTEQKKKEKNGAGDQNLIYVDVVFDNPSSKYEAPAKHEDDSVIYSDVVQNNNNTTLR